MAGLSSLAKGFRSIGWACLGLALLSPATSLGQTQAPPSREPPRVVVLDFPPQMGFAPERLSLLTQSFANGLEARGFVVISSAEASKTLGAEGSKRILACIDLACDQELAKTLHADFVARGSIASVDQGATLSLSMQGAGGEGVSRVEAPVASKATPDLLSSLNAMVPNLVQPIRDSGRWPALAVEAAVAPSRSTVAQAGEGTAKRVSTYALFGVGGVGLVAGAVSSLFYPADYAGLKAAATGKTPAASSSAGSSIRGTLIRDEAVGTVGFGVGVVAIGVGLYLYLSSMPGSTPPPSNLQFAPPP